MIETTLSLFSSVSFLIYGFLCLCTGHMKAEFKRYELERFRMLTGILEVAGGLGILVGFGYPPLYLFSTFGLGLLMGLGLITRIRSSDPVIQMVPALALMLINFWLFWVKL